MASRIASQRIAIAASRSSCVRRRIVATVSSTKFQTFISRRQTRSLFSTLTTCHHRPLSPPPILSRDCYPVLPLESYRKFPFVVQYQQRCFYSSSSSLYLTSKGNDEKTTNDKNDDDPKKHLPRLEDANPERIHGIKVNPDSIGYNVLPGNLIYKTYRLSGNTRKVPLELAHGYFWMVRDLKATNQKPTLSNDSLIPQAQAQDFPTLQNLTTLDDLETPVDISMAFLEKAHNLNATKSKSKSKQQRQQSGKVTLVSIIFRDNGVKLVESWMKPFEQAFAQDPNYSDKVQTFEVSITERWALYPIRNTIKRVMRNNTPVEKHSTTLAYFGKKEVLDFRDVLRMHNIMTNYVFLLDDLGKVRFAGSGEASPEESTKLIGFAKQLAKEKRTKSKR